jgi:hypothetical protein
MAGIPIHMVKPIPSIDAKSRLKTVENLPPKAKRVHYNGEIMNGSSRGENQSRMNQTHHRKHFPKNDDDTFSVKRPDNFV